MKNFKNYALRATICLVGAACSFLATSASAAFIDNFSSDTSANYVATGAGSSFDVSGGTLNATGSAGNTVTVSTANTLSLVVGESLGVDVPAAATPEGVFLILSTGVSAGGDSIRWRRDTSGASNDEVRFQSTGAGGFPFTVGGVDPLHGSAATLWIDRVTDTTFELQIQGIGAATRTSYGVFTHTGLAGDTNLYFGMQGFDTAANTFAFDNLRVVSTSSIGIPEPSSVVLGLLAGIGMVGLRRRRSA